MSAAEKKRWFSAVASIPDCQLCGAPATQVAHRDFGKGMGMKTAAFETAHLCTDCHRELTDGTMWTRDQKRMLMDRAIVNEHSALIRAGKLELKR